MQYYVTKTRAEELKKELENLKQHGRMRVAERLRRAKEFGDLSENSEYSEAKEEQRVVEQRIMELEDIVKNIALIEEQQGSDKVKIGSRVMVKMNAKVYDYQIVGSNEARPEEGKISNESPIGTAFLGRRVGDNVSVKTPGGEVIYQITKIE